MRIIILLVLMFIVVALLDDASNKIADQQQIIDSLQQELYITNINLGRYDITLELLQEQDSIAANKFNYIYTNETE